METNSNDKRLEILLKELVSSAAADETTIDEVISSPTVWRGVHRQIHDLPVASSFKLATIWRRVLIGAPTAVAAAVLIAVFVSQSAVSPEPVSEQAVLVQSEHVDAPPSSPREAAPEIPIIRVPEVEQKRPVQYRVLKGRPIKARPQIAQSGTDPAESEIKSEFIALSYARDPETGQIVRVKVPRSMMVTVGLLASVDEPATLVDAEVLLGDDGLTRAIRFIRQ